MHMTCSQCRHEFCWLCQGPWAEHGERTGGFYNCNRSVHICVGCELVYAGYAVTEQRERQGVGR